MANMIHFYHGLFGSPSDWTPFVSGQTEAKLHDLYLENKEQLLSIKTHPQDILIGYSMGGRIALEIARRNDFNLSRLVVLSAHPGLFEHERKDRKSWEDDVYHKMSHLSVKAFTEFWNGLELFNSSIIDEKLEENKLRESARLFHQFRLSEQPSNLEAFKYHKEKMTWVVGAKDPKYVALVDKRISSMGGEVAIVDADHRVLSAQQEIRDIFRKKGIQ